MARYFPLCHREKIARLGAGGFAAADSRKNLVNTCKHAIKVASTGIGYKHATYCDCCLVDLNCFVTIDCCVQDRPQEQAMVTVNHFFLVAPVSIAHMDT